MKRKYDQIHIIEAIYDASNIKVHKKNIIILIYYFNGEMVVIGFMYSVDIMMGRW